NPHVHLGKVAGFRYITDAIQPCKSTQPRVTGLEPAPPSEKDGAEPNQQVCMLHSSGTVVSSGDWSRTSSSCASDRRSTARAAPESLSVSPPGIGPGLRPSESRVLPAHSGDVLAVPQPGVEPGPPPSQSGMISVSPPGQSSSTSSVSAAGFEPAISTVREWRAHRTAPRGHQWPRWDSNPQHLKFWA